jgi:hypothetical protein
MNPGKNRTAYARLPNITGTHTVVVDPVKIDQ